MTNPNPYFDPTSVQTAVPPIGQGTGSAGAKNPLGLVALVLGVVALGAVLVHAVAQRIIISSDADYMLIGIVGGVISFVIVLIAIAAIIVGAIAITRPGLPRGAAGIGLGIGIAEVTSQVLWFLISLIPY